VQHGARIRRGGIAQSGGQHPGSFDGGTGWADLGFTTATEGVVVYGPANSDGNATQRPGQLLLTDDAGASWHRVRF
jgi:photosystem II stability/assembly factor-like uncharacterized protein